MRYLLAIIVFMSLCSVSTIATEDKEYNAILSSLKTGERSVTIKKLVSYHSRGKKHDQSLLLLAHLYSLEKQWDKSLKTYDQVLPEQRNITYWLAVLFVMSEEISLLDIPEHRAQVLPLVQGLKVHAPIYEKRTVEMMTKILGRLKDKTITKYFCDDLLAKNSKKCRVL